MGLERFRAAQAPMRARVEAELAAGRKTSHWMWFVFPQIPGLSQSEMGRRFAIRDPKEGRDYLADRDLGGWLRHTTGLVLGHRDKTAHAIFGAPDDAKFRSSMTLFAGLAGDGETVFGEALGAFFEAPCPATQAWLAAA